MGIATILTVFTMNFSVHTSMAFPQNPNQNMMKQMNQTGMMMGPMMGMAQGMTMPCMLTPITIGNQTMIGIIPCMMNPGMMMDAQQSAMRGWFGDLIVVIIPPVIDAMMMDPSQMRTMMNQINQTGMMMDPSQMRTMMNQINQTGMMMRGVQQSSMMGFWSEIKDIIDIITGPRIPPIIFVLPR